MANKMADKKKTTSRNQMAEPRLGTVPKASPARATSREERKEQSGLGTVPKASTASATSREQRKEQPKQESKSTRRDTKSSPSALQRFRNGRIGRFIGEAYYELRHKVTWPTFEEARNMTFVVIALSVVIGGILGLADFGLYNLFLLISARK